MTKYTDLYLITYSDDRFFAALENLIGSVHFWEPELRIVIYDLGMNGIQVHEVRNWKNVLYKKFNFSLYPPDVKQLKKYAWKSVILNESFHDYGYIFLQDAGQEFRRKIDPIRDILQKQGFFSTRYNDSKLSRDKSLAHPLTQKYLNIVLEKPFCEGGVIGLKKDHPRGEDIRNFVHDAVVCALIEQCIAPEGSSLSNHRYDQVVFTLLTQKYNLTCGGIEVCWVGSDSETTLTDDPKQSNDVVLCSRRLNWGRQYTKFLISNP